MKQIFNFSFITLPLKVVYKYVLNLFKNRIIFKNKNSILIDLYICMIFMLLAPSFIGCFIGIISLFYFIILDFFNPNNVNNITYLSFLGYFFSTFNGTPNVNSNINRVSRLPYTVDNLQELYLPMQYMFNLFSYDVSSRRNNQI
jgi:hypothetical protein